MLLRDEDGLRWLPIGVATLAACSAGYVAYQRWWPDDTATQVTVEEIVERYREQVPSPAPSAAAPPAPDTSPAAPPPSTQPPSTQPPSTQPPSTQPASTQPASTVPASTVPAAPAALPRPGVYRYTTAGHEHITALGGTEHTYPAETTITVTPGDCGVHLRWDLLVERFEEWNLCLVDGAVTLQPTGVQFHEFFGQTQTDASDCRATVALDPAPPPGSAIDRDCRLAGAPWNPVWRAGAPGTATVAGATVATTTFEVTIDLAGEYPEHSTQRWTFGPGGLPVAIEFDMHSANPSPVGDVTYTEVVTATLVDLHPIG